jgi:hypothetical protein
MSGVPTADEEQKRAFQGRLARIGADGMPDSASSRAVPAPRRVTRPVGPRRKRPKARFRITPAYPAGILAAALIGALGVVAARLGRASLADGALTGSAAETMMMIDAGVGLGLAVIVTALVRLHGKAAFAAQVAGVLAMLLLMHNLVHLAPTSFAMLFSAPWVVEVTATTAPGSFLIQGVYIVF